MEVAWYLRLGYVYIYIICFRNDKGTTIIGYAKITEIDYIQCTFFLSDFCNISGSQPT